MISLGEITTSPSFPLPHFNPYPTAGEAASPCSPSLDHLVPIPHRYMVPVSPNFYNCWGSSRIGGQCVEGASLRVIKVSNFRGNLNLLEEGMT